MDDPILFNPKTHSHLIPSFADILTACITTPPYTTAGFLPPIDPARLQKWWEDRVREQSEGHRKIIMQMARDPSTGEEELAGYVMLSIPATETGPFRGSVEKLMVSPKYRQKGIAGRLMTKLEEVARAEGRTLLLLDTESGSPAELVYPKWGYIEAGKIPDYGISPLDGSLKPTTIFYKNLLSGSKEA